MVVREILGRHVRLAAVVMCVSMLFCALSANVGAGIVFTDDFEGSTLDPFWSKIEQSGSITFPSSAQVHTGSQAVQFNSTSGGQKHIALHHDFAAPVYGTSSVWMYDTGANSSSSNYLSLVVYDGSSYSVVSTDDYNFGNSAYYRVGRTPNAGYYSNIARTEDWHKFSITTSADSVTFYVDNTLVHTVSSGMQLEWLRIEMSGPSWRPAWTGYFDDFSFTEATTGVVPEPSTFAIWSVMGLSFVGIGWYRRRKAA